MQTTKHQQIIIYFIEEAKEHLDTIEQSLLNLQATMDDPERLNELFRAAHSVKGGAAMLGFVSIQKVGHYLEDGFKLLKENSVRVDRHLENLFLQGFDVLKHLVIELQSPYGLQDHDADRIVQAAAPMFTELESYLNRLMRGGVAGPATPSRVTPETAQPPAVLNAGLRQMLALFKQADTPAGRQKLVGLCAQLMSLHPGPQWQGLLQVAGRAILADSTPSPGASAQTRVPYKILAPVLIKELKQAGDLLVAGRVAEIAPSPRLKDLAGMPAPTATAAPRPTQSPQAATGPIPAGPIPAAPSSGGKVAQIMIPTEPRAAARALLNAFNKNQLIELAEYLMKAIQ